VVNLVEGARILFGEWGHRVVAARRSCALLIDGMSKGGLNWQGALGCSLWSMMIA